MQYWINPTLAAGLLAVAVGCATRPATAPATDRTVFSAFQHAVATASNRVDPSLALVKIQKEESPQSQLIQPGVSASTGGSTSFSGVVLTGQGHLLVPGILKPDSDDRIIAWIGDTEYVARPFKTDDTLGMSILKIDSDDTFTPLNLTNSADLAAGEWGVVLIPSGEETDFQKIITLVTCRGEVAGRYRRFLVTGLPRDGLGAPVVNMYGQVVGLLDSRGALALTDLAEDLNSFIAEATGGRASIEDPKQRGWFGAVLQPINKEYAQAHTLPTSALWVLHVNGDSPAAAAGLHPGDLITGLNGQPLRLTGARVQDYFLKALRPRVGTPFTVTVLRAGKSVDYRGTISKRPELKNLRADDLGVTVAAITDSDVISRNLFTPKGVLVTDVNRGSPAATSSRFGKTLLLNQDVIVELAGYPTPDLEAFGQALEHIRRDQPAAVLVKYWRGSVTGYAGLNMKIGEKENGGAK